MADLLRGTAAFPRFAAALQVALVEVSPRLRAAQWGALGCQGEPPPGLAGDGSDEPATAAAEDSGAARGVVEGEGEELPPPPSGTSSFGGVQVTWHRSLEHVPSDLPALYIAHEFIDALPVHQFQRTPGVGWVGRAAWVPAGRPAGWDAFKLPATLPQPRPPDRGWVERLVDVASPDSPLHLRLVLSPGATPAARVLLPRRLQQLGAEAAAQLDQIEICPQARGGGGGGGQAWGGQAVGDRLWC